MRSATEDPTAGRRARQKHARPDLPQRVEDPMDSRFGEFAPATSPPAGPVRLIVDPTDPNCGKPLTER